MHARPHMPQLRESVMTSEQVSVQSVCPVAQPTRHMRFEHTLPLGHGALHAPQFERSLLMSTQRPEQSVAPGGHAPRRQRLIWQVKLVAQAARHEPQLRLSLVRSTQRSPHAA